MTPISRCHVVHPQFHPQSAENDTRKSGSDAGSSRPGRGSVLPPQTTRCIQKYLPLTPSLWNVGCKPIFAAVEHISARRRPILNLHSGRDSPGRPLTTVERRRAVKVQNNGPHWVGYFAKAPELLTSKKDNCCLASLSMNEALETEPKAMELQLEVCI